MEPPEPAAKRMAAHFQKVSGPSPSQLSGRIKGPERTDLSQGYLATEGYQKAQDFALWELTGNIDMYQVTPRWRKGRRDSFLHYLYLQNCLGL